MVTSIAALASAQTDEQRAAARVAATEGVKALEQGRYQDALDYCKRAESIMHAPTHLLLIARADAKLGRLVEAQEAYIRIQREPLAADAPPAFVEARQKATEEQNQLAPRVPTLKIELQGGKASDVTVTMDGSPLPAALIGLAGPVNPGQHTLEAKGPQLASEPVTLTLAEGARQSVTLALQPVAGAEAVPPSAAASSEAERPKGNAGLSAGGWIGIGVGAAGLIAGTVFVVKNRSDRNSANALCNPSGCPASKRADITSFDDGANSAATLAWVSYGIGAAGLATGAVLLLMGNSKSTSAQSARVTPWVLPRSAGLTVSF